MKRLMVTLQQEMVANAPQLLVQSQVMMQVLQHA